MEKLQKEDLYSLEQYAEKRAEFRARVLEHKKHRRVDIGPNLSLYFEDRLTIQYQVQEMLRIEKIFEADGIREELEAYNPLIPDGSNLKCTAMFEFEDVKLKLTDEALRAIAKEAIKRSVGARGLRIIMEELMLEMMYNVPSQHNITECVITEEVVYNKVQPLMLYKQAG